MTRRTVTKRAFLFAIGMALGKLNVLKAEGGQLTCDLNQWSHVVFAYKGKRITVPVSEIFSVLAEGRE